MVLLDTSAWIHYLKRGHLTFEQLKSVVVCPPVIQEVLQGVKDARYWNFVHDGLTSLPFIASPVTLPIYIEAAEIFRAGRKKGHTIRSSTDCLIAAIAIENKLPIHHFDRDFDTIAKFTALEIAEEI